ncbi:MAG: hypothetical protein LBJ81_01450 [Puniceicoccales bacterium]|jgi:hypothetical protein|nr:hypothetical protein [Puniceicoccales bacterium]
MEMAVYILGLLRDGAGLFSAIYEFNSGMAEFFPKIFGFKGIIWKI